MGDLLTERVGMHLRNQNKRFRTRTLRGARIEDITKNIRKVENDDKKEDEIKNLIVMAGTNNLTCDGTEEIL